MGAADTAVVSEPSGFAVVVTVGVLSMVATTGWPVDSAWVSASASDSSVLACAAGAATGAMAIPVARPGCQQACGHEARASRTHASFKGQSPRRHV